VAGRLVLTRVNTERTLEPEQMLALCREANPTAPANIAPSLAAALKETEEARVVVITGSLYLVGEAIELLGLSPAPATEERGLNDWGRSLAR
jgi:folylpolyglutamate synthase/dihydropteroate synthase